MSKKVVIIGAGPAGLYTALNIQNHDVLILEEHSSPGKPRHCAGIVGNLTARSIGKISPRLEDQSYKRIIFITPREKLEVEFKNPVAYHVKRPLLEEILASRVEARGHRVLYSSRAKPRGKNHVVVSNNTINYDILIVAEGAKSNFRDTLISSETKYIYGVQLEARTKEIQLDTIIIIYSHSNPYFFAWITPISENTIQVGYASMKPHIETLYKLTKKANIEITSIIEKYGGLIPVHKPLKNPVLHENIIFHGDSVPLVKPYTGGGLYYIFKLSPVLGEYIDKEDLSKYTMYYTKKFYINNSIEHTLTSMLRSTRYYIPVRILYKLRKLRLLVEEDYDNHYRIALKAITTAPLLSTLLFS